MFVIFYHFYSKNILFLFVYHSINCFILVTQSKTTEKLKVCILPIGPVYVYTSEE